MTISAPVQLVGSNGGSVLAPAAVAARGRIGSRNGCRERHPTRVRGAQVLVACTVMVCSRSRRTGTPVAAASVCGRAAAVDRAHPQPVAAGARRRPRTAPTAARCRSTGRWRAGPAATGRRRPAPRPSTRRRAGPRRRRRSRPARPPARCAPERGVSMRDWSWIDGSAARTPSRPAPSRPAGGERGRLDVDDPLARRHVAVEAGHDDRAPGSRARSAAARRSCRPRAARRGRP